MYPFQRNVMLRHEEARAAPARHNNASGRLKNITIGKCQTQAPLGDYPARYQ